MACHLVLAEQAGINSDISSKVFPFPLKICHYHLPNTDGYIPGLVFLPINFPVEREAVPTYCNEPKNGSCFLHTVIVSKFWIVKCP